MLSSDIYRTGHCTHLSELQLLVARAVGRASSSLRLLLLLRRLESLALEVAPSNWLLPLDVDHLALTLRPFPLSLSFSIVLSSSNMDDSQSPILPASPEPASGLAR
jgi:hypothetical protein